MLALSTLFKVCLRDKIIKNAQTRKHLEIFPSMLVLPNKTDTIFVSNFDVCFSRAFAVVNIKKAFVL